MLSRLTGKNVYNLALGRYSPNQYYSASDEGVRFETGNIIGGLYMGDDFDNAYRITYGLKYWSSLRCGGARSEV